LLGRKFDLLHEVGECGVKAREASVEWVFTFAAVAYNLVRMRPLLVEETA
jgi:hypothetical protein